MEVASEIGISQAQVSRLEKGANQENQRIVVIFSPFASYVFTAEVFLWFAVCRI